MKSWTIESIMPAVGFGALFFEDDKPYWRIRPIIAWATCREYYGENDTTGLISVSGLVAWGDEVNVVEEFSGFHEYIETPLPVSMARALDTIARIEFESRKRQGIADPIIDDDEPSGGAT